MTDRIEEACAQSTSSGLVAETSGDSPRDAARSVQTAPLLTTVQYLNDTSTFQVLKDFHANHYFDFGDDFVAPFGTVNLAEGKTLSYEFLLDEKEPVISPSDSLVDFFYFDTSDIYDVTSFRSLQLIEDDSLYQVVLENGKNYHSIRVGATYCRPLDLSAYGETTVLHAMVAGEVLIMDSLYLTSPDTVMLVLTVGASGDVHQMQTISGIDLDFQPMIEGDGRSVIVTVKAGGAGLSVNGVQAMPAGSIAIVSFDLNDQLQALSNLECRDYEVLLGVYGSRDQTAYVAAKYDTLEKFLVLGKYHRDGTALDMDTVTFRVDSLCTESFDLDYIFHQSKPGNQELLVGITFADTAFIETDTFVSKGGTDVLILRLDEDGSVISANSYGERFSETVSQVMASYYPPDNTTYLFFGGEFSSKIYKRQLGDVEFINPKRGVQKAYISYIAEPEPLSDEPGEVTTPLAQTQVVQDVVSPSQLTAFPNPFTDGFVLEYNSPEATTIAVEITDLFGRSVWRKQVDLAGGKVRVDVDLGRHVADGLYLANVKDDQGNTGSVKVLKAGHSEPRPDDD